MIVVLRKGKNPTGAAGCKPPGLLQWFYSFVTVPMVAGYEPCWSSASGRTPFPMNWPCETLHEWRVSKNFMWYIYIYILTPLGHESMHTHHSFLDTPKKPASSYQLKLCSARHIEGHAQGVQPQRFTVVLVWWWWWRECLGFEVLVNGRLVYSCFRQRSNIQLILLATLLCVDVSHLQRCPCISCWFPVVGLILSTTDHGHTASTVWT